ncbi:MAG: sigma 54-interacting transcriptional regulator [Firmicutes bacterium]|jgi:transcriptional regulator of aroF, aroG, tyrA and aromatic amino acid transport|nr:sigma 54-interacting transcriptional regulator [Bacillota bacterium]
MATTRLRIDTEDKVGMVLRVVGVIAGRGVNIRAMEVYPNVIYAVLDDAGRGGFSGLIAALEGTPDVRRVTRIRSCPHEDKERQTSAVLSSVNEAIVAVDRARNVTIMNPAAERLLGVRARDALGRPVEEFLGPDAPIARALATGKPLDNVKGSLNVAGRTVEYMSSVRLIADHSGAAAGAVSILRDMEDVRHLAESARVPGDVVFEDIIHVSKCMDQVIQLARSVARSSSSVVIYGESGTGKELFARAIHSASDRCLKRFVPINCAALPETLLESEIFGYEEGAFTGAQKGGKAGLMEFASEGTIFFDEIEELAPPLQAKLLRALQEGRVRRVGGHREIPVDCRVIAATNADLRALVALKRFRDDLYYRLNVFPIVLPPLRERREDIPVLVGHFLRQLGSRLGKRVTRVSREALETLTLYDWPGNIRELRNVIERAVNLADGEEITRRHLVLDSALSPASAPVPGTGLRASLAEAERALLAEAVSRHGSSRKVARALGVSHTTVLNKIRKYGLRRENAERKVSTV